MSDRSIDFLLGLYEKPYVKGEKRSTETNKRLRHNRKLKNRYLLLDELLAEAKPLTLSPNQVKLVKYMITDFNTQFKELHKRCKEETIILAFIFYVKKVEDSRLKVSNWRICTKYELTDHVFEIILCRLLKNFMERCPIRLSESTKDIHEVLDKEGIR